DGEPPAAIDERAAESETQASRSSGDDCCRHAFTVRPRRSQAPLGIGPRTRGGGAAGAALETSRRRHTRVTIAPLGSKTGARGRRPPGGELSGVRLSPAAGG